MEADHLMRRDDIDCIKEIGVECFKKKYFKPKKPVIITNVARNWPAMSKWSFEYFKNLASTEDVLLESGNVLQGDTLFSRSRLQDYLEELLSNKKSANKSYLSLFNIFKTFPKLEQDVDFSLIRSNTLINHVFGWVGPQGTLTGFHIDWIDNILAQISGRKRISLASPLYSPKMYPSSKYDYRSTLSSLDPDNYEPEKYPLFKDVRIHEFVLSPGEMVFIPRGWWHRVESLDPSISVNNFGHDLKGLLIYQSIADCREILHQLGIIGKNCTCHMICNGKRTKKF